ARRGRPFDIVNVHEPSGSLLALLKTRAGNPAVVATSHGLERRGWEVSLEEGRLGRDGPSRKTRILYPLTSLWQSELTLRKADHVFCLNYEDRDYLTTWLRMPPERVSRIFPAAHPIYACGAERRNYCRCRRILFAGTWISRKGTQDAVEAFCTIAQRLPHMEFIVLGGGAPPAVILEAFPELLRHRIHPQDASNDEESARVFADCDIFLLPSVFEGTPLTLIEAMYSGLPVVTTRTCGMKDVIVDGETGILIPTRSPGAITEAIERLAGDAALRERLGRAAHATAVNKYTWKTVAEPVRDVYARLRRSQQ